jgi:hypothetical protein
MAKKPAKHLRKKWGAVLNMRLNTHWYGPEPKAWYTRRPAGYYKQLKGYIVNIAYVK